MNLQFDLDPSGIKVAIMGILLFLETLLAALLVILQEGNMPTTQQWTTILVVASIALVTYFSTFLKTEEGS